MEQEHLIRGHARRAYHCCFMVWNRPAGKDFPFSTDCAGKRMFPALSDWFARGHLI